MQRWRQLVPLAQLHGGWSLSLAFAAFSNTWFFSAFLPVLVVTLILKSWPPSFLFAPGCGSLQLFMLFCTLFVCLLVCLFICLTLPSIDQRIVTWR